MKNWRWQRGEIPMGCIVGLVFAAIVAIIAMKVAPIMLDMGDLEREVRILADRGNRIEYNDKRIIKEILAKAKELELPVTEESIKVERSSGRIVVDVQYEKAIEFPGYTYVWKKHLHEDRPLF